MQQMFSTSYLDEKSKVADIWQERWGQKRQGPSHTLIILLARVK